MTKEQLIAKLAAAFPQGKFVDAGEFYGKPNSGIWIRGEFDIDGIPAVDTYDDFGLYKEGLHPALAAIVVEAGWRAEPHDAGTMMLYD